MQSPWQLQRADPIACPLPPPKAAPQERHPHLRPQFLPGLNSQFQGQLDQLTLMPPFLQGHGEETHQEQDEGHHTNGARNGYGCCAKAERSKQEMRMCQLWSPWGPSAAVGPLPLLGFHIPKSNHLLPPFGASLLCPNFMTTPPPGPSRPLLPGTPPNSSPLRPALLSPTC